MTTTSGFANDGKTESEWMAGFPLYEFSTILEDHSRQEKARRTSRHTQWPQENTYPQFPIHEVRIECLAENFFVSQFNVIQASTSQTMQAQIVEDALERVYALERQEQGRLSARNLMFFIEFNFKNNNITLTSAMLERVNLKALGIHALIGLSRSTLRARAKLPAWNSIYKKSREKVEELGYKADEMFIGMPEPEGALRDDNF